MSAYKEPAFSELSFIASQSKMYYLTCVRFLAKNEPVYNELLDKTNFKFLV